MAGCLNNLGVGLGEAGTGFGGLSETAKWLLTLAMLLGRLDLFPVLLLVNPVFWRG
jgi:trk system potassium uptake protein